MAVLSDTEVIERINNPRNSSSIGMAQLQEGRLLMHSESILEKLNLPFWAYRNFQVWWQSLVTQEKYVKIENLITTPLVTTSLVEDIFKQIGKFRDAQDRYISFDFTNRDYTNDFQEYLTSINIDSFWRDICLDALKTGINDIVVIDLPADQKSLRPEPYQYLVNPSMMLDLEINKYKGNVEYFIFRQSTFKWDSALQSQAANYRYPQIDSNTDMLKCIAIDDESYRVLARDNKSSTSENNGWFIISKSKHGLGYCPCIDFWQPSIKGTNGINKKGILTNLLSKLDMYLFYSALVAWMDIYGAFPIFVTYAMEDGEYDDKRRDFNSGEYYNPQTTTYLNGNSTAQDPRKSFRWMVGPGSVLVEQRPADANDANFVKDSAHFINMPSDALKHVNDRGESLKNEIFEYATGECKEYMNEIAKNKDMFDASFNKQDSILTFVKRQVERVHEFSLKTMANLRYGNEYLKSCTVDYGRDFILKDATAIVEEYKQAKEAGMHPDYCNELSQQAILTRFKNNEDKLARNRIIKDLIPYHDISLENLQLLQLNISDVDNFIIRINSNNFTSRFELEFGDIVKFASKIPYSDKISLIKEQLNNYGRELKKNWVSVKPEPAGTEGAKH